MSASRPDRQPLFTDSHALAALCRRHHITRRALFGSTLVGKDQADSDVDLLVAFEPGHKPGLMGMARIEAELSALIGAGRRVDLRMAEDLSRHFRTEIVQDARVHYAA